MDFEPLTPEQTVLLERWLRLSKARMGAYLAQTQAIAQARLAAHLESKVPSSKPGALSHKAQLLRRRADALMAASHAAGLRSRYSHRLRRLLASRRPLKG